MTLTVTDQELLDRLRAGAIKYDPVEYLAVMEPAWDTLVSQTKSLRAEMYDQSKATVTVVWGVKRRQRTEVFESVAAASAEGYIMGRYLLGTGTARPSYQHTDADIDSCKRQIDKAMKPYSFDEINGVLQCGNRDLAVVVFDSTTRPGPLDKKGPHGVHIILLGSYVLGIAMALAEEQVFGPLGG